MNDDKRKDLEEKYAFLRELPHLRFSRRPAATPEEATDTRVIWGVKSLREVVEEADRRFGTTPKGGVKNLG